MLAGQIVQILNFLPAAPIFAIVFAKISILNHKHKLTLRHVLQRVGLTTKNVPLALGFHAYNVSDRVVGSNGSIIKRV